MGKKVEPRPIKTPAMSRAQHSPWKEGTDPGTASRSLRCARDLLEDAESAIEAQQKLIEHDGLLKAHRLSLDALHAEHRKIRAEIARIMERRVFEFVDFALDGPRYAAHRANAQHLSAFLHAIQKLYAHVKYGKLVHTPRATIPSALQGRCQLDVEAFFPSSFGVRFVAHTETDLVDGYSATNEALEATFDLVAADNPLEVAERVTPWAMRQYRNLVTVLVKAEATPKVTWTTPSGDERSWAIDSNALITIRNRLASLRCEPTRTLEAKGTLTGASLRRRRFEFSGASLITGTAPKELEAKLTAYFGKPCRIIFSETVFIDDSTDQEKRVRMLLDIADV